MASNELPDYRDRQTINGPSITVGPIQSINVPDLHAGQASTAAAQALSGLGAEIADVAKKISDGVQHTRATEAMSGFLDDNDKLTRKYIDDKDYATSEDRYRQEVEKAKLQRLENIADPQLRTRTELMMKRATIEGAGTVRANSLTKQKDINVAGLDTFEGNALRSASTAPSDQARIAVIDQYAGEVERLRQAGWIDDRTAVQRGQNFKTQLDTADAMSAIQKNPQAAYQRLLDPNQFSALDPVKRQSFVQAAIERNDSNTVATITSRATFDPIGATLSVGRVTSADQSQKIFDSTILKIESDGKPDAVSPKGALGLAQLMPATAREVAQRLGLSDVAALPDEELKTRLLSDPALNVRIGRAYWTQMVTRYDGNVALAAVAYNAGPANADRWKAAAEQKFGPSFSPAQLQSVVDFAESRNYIGKLYKVADAPMDVAFSSPATALRAANGVGAVLTQQQSQADHLLKVQAAAVASAEPFEKMLQEGLNLDPGAIEGWRATQRASAARGDEAAATKLRALDEALQLHPYVQQAWKTAPAQLDGLVANLESNLNGSPNASPALRNQVQAFKAVRDEVVKLRNTNPIALGERGGYYQPIAIDPNANPDDPSFRATLTARGAQALTAQKVYLGSAAALKPEEARALKERYDAGNSDDKFRMVQALAATLPGNAYADTLKQIAGDDSGVQFVGKIAQTRPEIAREIFKGMALGNTEGVKNKMGDVRTALASKLGGQLYAGADQQGAVVDASLALYTARRGGSGTLYDATDEGAIEKAIEDVAGTIVKRNGARVAAPPGMTAGQFNSVMDSIDTNTFAGFGGAYDRNGQPFDPVFLRAHAQLQQLQPGGSRYVVMVPGSGGRTAPVMQAPDALTPPAPLVIDLAQIRRTAPAAVGWRSTPDAPL